MFVEKIRKIAEELDVLEISEIVISNPKFPVWSGSSKPYQHHYGEGGLAQHTFEVIDLCLLNNNYYKNTNKFIDEKRLFLAALFHDSGKMFDYEPLNYGNFKEWKSTNHKRNIHHISRSGIIWSQAFLPYYNCEKPLAGKYDSTINDDVLHAILSHHGQREWGSPVAPNTRLAWLLHLCDCISARMDDADKWDQIKKN